MKLENEELLLKRDLGWRNALLCVGLALAAIVLLYRDTALSMVALWGSSDTYAHGYLIAPIALGLAWMKRQQLAALAPQPDGLGLALLAAAGLLWLVAEAGQVQVLQQYALTAMIPATVLAIAGRRVARVLAFPLAFLLFAVPFGEAFLPRLMDWTADFTVGALRLTGIPVYREGRYFAIPSGHWSVVEACSGLRYLIASITVGALYAYLTYSRWWKRVVCVAFSILIPIGANFVRAYTVVMVGHLTNMKYAVGLDHIIYGWVFFGLVMLAFFWMGSFWRDDPLPARETDHARPPILSRPALMPLVVIGVVALAAVWPLYAAHLDRIGTSRVTLLAPAGVSGWTLEVEPVQHWSPHYGGAAATMLVTYRKENRTVLLYLSHFRNQRQGAELVSSQNSLAGERDSTWSITGAVARTELFGSSEVALRETRLRSARQRLLVWDWYRIAGENLSNPYLAKALLARDKLLARGDASSAVVIAAPYEVRSEEAAETLRLFLRDMFPAIDAALAQATQGKPG